MAREEAEGTLPEQSLVIFEHTDPHFATLKARLGVIDGRRQAMDGDALLSPLRSAVGELDDRRERIGDLVATYDRARALVPDFSGSRSRSATSSWPSWGPARERAMRT